MRLASPPRLSASSHPSPPPPRLPASVSSPSILFRSLPLLLCEKLSLPSSERFNLSKSNPLQGFHKVEVDGEGQPASKMPAPLRWSPAFLDPSLRISREADGTFSVYSKARVLVMCHACGVHTHTTRKTAHHTHPPLATQVDSADTQAAIARLAETPVELEEEEDEVEDNRPRWDRPSDRWGQTESGGGSDIP